MANNQPVPGATVHISDPGTAMLVKIINGTKIRIIYANNTFEEMSIIRRPPNLKNLEGAMECGDEPHHRRTHGEFLNMREFLRNTARTALGSLVDKPDLKWADVPVKIRSDVVEVMKAKYVYLNRFFGDWATLEMFVRNLRNLRGEKKRKPRTNAAPAVKRSAKPTEAAAEGRSIQDKRPAGGSSSAANRQNTAKAVGSNKGTDDCQSQVNDKGKGKAPLPSDEPDESTTQTNKHGGHEEEDEEEGEEEGEEEDGVVEHSIELHHSQPQVEVVEEEEEGSDEEDGNKKDDGKKGGGDQGDEEVVEGGDEKGDTDDEDDAPPKKRRTRRVATVVQSDDDSELSEAPPSSTIHASSTVPEDHKGRSVSSTLVSDSTPPESPALPPRQTKKRKAADKSDTQTIERLAKKQKTPDAPEPPIPAPPKPPKKTQTAAAPDPLPEPTTTKARRALAPLAVTTRRQAAKSVDASSLEEPEDPKAAPKPKEAASKKRKTNTIERADSWNTDYEKEVSSLPPPPPPKKKKTTAPPPSEPSEPGPSKPSNTNGRPRPKMRSVPDKDEPAPITSRAAKQELIESTEQAAETGSKAQRGGAARKKKAKV